MVRSTYWYTAELANLTVSNTLQLIIFCDKIKWYTETHARSWHKGLHMVPIDLPATARENKSHPKIVTFKHF